MDARTIRNLQRNLRRVTSENSRVTKENSLLRTKVTAMRDQLDQKKVLKVFALFDCHDQELPLHFSISSKASVMKILKVFAERKNMAVEDLRVKGLAEDIDYNNVKAFNVMEHMMFVLKKEHN